MNRRNFLQNISSLWAMSVVPFELYPYKIPKWPVANVVEETFYLISVYNKPVGLNNCERSVAFVQAGPGITAQDIINEFKKNQYNDEYMLKTCAAIGNDIDKKAFRRHLKIDTIKALIERISRAQRLVLGEHIVEKTIDGRDFKYRRYSQIRGKYIFTEHTRVLDGKAAKQFSRERIYDLESFAGEMIYARDHRARS